MGVLGAPGAHLGHTWSSPGAHLGHRNQGSPPGFPPPLPAEPPLPSLSWYPNAAEDGGWSSPEFPVASPSPRSQIQPAGMSRAPSRAREGPQVPRVGLCRAGIGSRAPPGPGRILIPFPIPTAPQGGLWGHISPHPTAPSPSPRCSRPPGRVLCPRGRGRRCQTSHGSAVGTRNSPKPIPVPRLDRPCSDRCSQRFLCRPRVAPGRIFPLRTLGERIQPHSLGV